MIVFQTVPQGARGGRVAVVTLPAILTCPVSLKLRPGERSHGVTSYGSNRRSGQARHSCVENGGPSPISYSFHSPINTAGGQHNHVAH